jgi:hypothetical protein
MKVDAKVLNGLDQRHVCKLAANQAIAAGDVVFEGKDGYCYAAIDENWTGEGTPRVRGVAYRDASSVYSVDGAVSVTVTDNGRFEVTLSDVAPVFSVGADVFCSSLGTFLAANGGTELFFGKMVAQSDPVGAPKVVTVEIHPLYIPIGV